MLAISFKRVCNRLFVLFSITDTSVYSMLYTALDFRQNQKKAVLFNTSNYIK